VSDLTTDRSDPRLSHGVDEAPVPQAEAYLVLSAEELAKGYVRPYRDTYRHVACKVNSALMGMSLSATYARQPSFYGATYCVACHMHRPVAEFVWDADGSVVGS
jgi:hypothetical protein